MQIAVVPMLGRSDPAFQREFFPQSATHVLETAIATVAEIDVSALPVPKGEEDEEHFIPVKEQEGETAVPAAPKGEEEHGGTWFPYASDNGGGHDTPPSSVDEAVATALRELNPAQRGLTIAPKKGAAILFFNHRPDGSVDHLAVHAGLPVLNGEKWAANFWYGPMGNNPE